ncbi:MAG: ArnT family glycosyltransferase [Thermomicrobiales bacterium]
MASASVGEREPVAEGASGRADGRAPATRRVAFRRRAAAGRLAGLPRIVAGATALLALGSILWIYFRRLALNPPGFFCDEAEIGFRTWQLLHGTLPSPSLRFPAFYQHIDYTVGALPLYVGAPFIALFGLNETSVRATATTCMVVSLLAMVLLTRRLGLRNGWVGVLAFALSPLVIHMARFNMAHPIGFMMTVLGVAVYAVARDRRSIGLSLLGGALIGIAAYANPVWYIVVPAIFASLGVGELVVNGLAPIRWRSYVLAAVGALLSWIPLFHRMLTDDNFFDRFTQKQGSGAASFTSWTRWQEMLSEYPKYFSFDFLFRSVPDGGNLRHAVPGAGVFSLILLPLFLLGVVAVVTERRGTAKVIGIGAIMMTVLFPVADLPTTVPQAPPYTFSIFPMLLGVPIVCAFGVALASRWIGGMNPRAWRQGIVPVALSAIILFGGWAFYRGPYADYGRDAGGYYGWQFGPGEAIAAFKADNFQHDHYYLDSDFNGAYVFLDFYLAEDPELAAVTSLGAPHERAISGSSLYAVRVNRWNDLVDPNSPIRRYARLVGVIDYPDGTPALYLISISPQNTPTPINNW